MKPSEIKANLKAGYPVFGIMLSAIHGGRWTQMLASTTLDYVVIDWEHGFRPRDEIAAVVNTAKSADLTAIVRVPDVDPLFVAMARDAGADGVLVPYCEDLDMVKACASKLRLHPLKGEWLHRASTKGQFPSEKTQKYLENRNKDLLFVLGVESKPAVDKIEDLLNCGEIDGVFVGPNDMTTSLGIPDEVSNELYIRTVEDLVSVCDARGIPMMVHHQTMETSLKILEIGARFVLHSSDANILRNAINSDMERLRKAAVEKWGAVLDVQVDDRMDVV